LAPPSFRDPLSLKDDVLTAILAQSIAHGQPGLATTDDDSIKTVADHLRSWWDLLPGCERVPGSHVNAMLCCLGQGSLLVPNLRRISACRIPLGCTERRERGHWRGSPSVVEGLSAQQTCGLLRRCAIVRHSWSAGGISRQAVDGTAEEHAHAGSVVSSLDWCLRDDHANGAALLGVWRMASWQREFLAMGERMDVLGPERVGYIPDSTDGRCSVIFERV
jgi:hypothetical protein